MSGRLKGQEVEMVVIVDGTPQRNLTCFRSLDFTWLLTKSSEGYLGETTERKDSIFKGVSGNIEMHTDNPGILTFLQKVIDRARNRTAGTKINIKTTLQYPDGSRPRVIIPDVEFGDIPIGIPGRADYVTAKLDYEAADAQIIG